MVIKDYKNEDVEEKTIVEALKMEGILKELEDAVIKARDEIYLPFLDNFLSKLTVTCFSASGWDNQLMWSHYANSYSGICVEYNFEKMDKFIGFMYPVKYSSVRPTVLLKDLGLTKFKKDENGELITDEVNISAIFSYLLGTMTLYDVYCVLSERCHNCYFDSFLKDINAINAGVPKIGLNEEHLMLLNTMIACVLIEY